MIRFRKKLSALLLLSAFVFSACTEKQANKAGQNFQFSGDVALARAQLSGNTLHFTGGGHGTQIEYFNPNGTAYLWYPGNKSGVPSRWKVEASDRSNAPVNICFQYPKRSYNPVTHQFGGRWECRPIALFAAGLDAVHRGDPYKLANGSIPRTLPRKMALSPGQVATHIGQANAPKTIWKRETTQ